MVKHYTKNYQCDLLRLQIRLVWSTITRAIIRVIYWDSISRASNGTCFKIMSHADNISDTACRECRNARRRELHWIQRAAETPEQHEKRRDSDAVSSYMRRRRENTDHDDERKRNWEYMQRACKCCKWTTSKYVRITQRAPLPRADSFVWWPRCYRVINGNCSWHVAHWTLHCKEFRLS